MKSSDAALGRKGKSSPVLIESRPVWKSLPVFSLHLLRGLLMAAKHSCFLEEIKIITVIVIIIKTGPSEDASYVRGQK